MRVTRRSAAVVTLIVLIMLAGDAGAGWVGGRQRCCPVEVVVVPSSEDAIRAVLDAQVAAWNRGDLEGFMAGYWKSENLTFMSGGTVTHGWQATMDRYRKRYQG